MMKAHDWQELYTNGLTLEWWAKQDIFVVTRRLEILGKFSYRGDALALLHSLGGEVKPRN